MADKEKLNRYLCGIVFAIVLASCGGGGGGSGGTAQTPPPATSGSEETPPAPEPEPEPEPEPISISYPEAFRFLRQSTFGPTASDVELVQSIGFEAWINEQRIIPVSTQLPYMDSLPEPDDLDEGHLNRMDAWFQNSIAGPDQLRQRVAFALSEIMVVSDQSELIQTPRGLANYYDLLSQHAFGNFRELMEAVALSPVMGIYLSVLGNEKPNVEKNIRPDENFAREMMQLFTIGLFELNPDGSKILDTAGQPVATYTQQIVEGFAHVYTGWTFAGSATFQQPSFDYINPMQAHSAFHDSNQKKLLHSVLLPAGQSAEEDLEQALNNIYQHSNVAPFISHRLIQRLVTANPSPAYVERVSAIFDDDGTGIKGNLFAVIKAILMDAEARNLPTTETSGKLTEPLLRITALWRAYSAKAANGRYSFSHPEFRYGQAPLRAASVFNFFNPDHAPSGEISDLSLVSPEMQITNETTAALANTHMAGAIYLQNSEVLDLRNDAIVIDISSELEFANQPEELINRTVNRLLGGTMSESLGVNVRTMLDLVPEEDATGRVIEVIHTIATSPEFALLR